MDQDKLINQNSNDRDMKELNSLSLENAQLHSLSERLARAMKKLINYPDLINFYTKEINDVLADYDKFKEEVIWKDR